MRTLNQIVAIAVKDLKQLLRDKVAAFFVLVFPLFVSLMFGTIFGGGGSEAESDALKVGVFNEDTGKESAGFVKSLDDDSAIAVRSVGSMEEGNTLVRKGECVACLHLGPGFDPQQVFGRGILIEGVVDPKRAAEAGLLEGKLNQIAFMQMSNMFLDPAASRQMMEKARKSLDEMGMSAEVKQTLGRLFGSVEAVSDEVEKARKAEEAEATKAGTKGDAKTVGMNWQPVRVDLQKLSVDRKGPPSAFAMSFPQGVVWGLMGLVTGFASGFAMERLRGTLIRLNVAPVPSWAILAGKALACFVACLMVQGLMLGVASIPYFKVTFGSPVLVLVSCVVTAFALSGVAMMIAGLSRSEEAAGGLARAVLIVLAMLGGGSIPLIFMPPLMRTISVISPFKWTTEALEGSMWRGFTTGEMMLPLGVLVGIGVVGFGVGAMGMRRQREG
jgi:ABC-2 type transport system permease protein